MKKFYFLCLFLSVAFLASAQVTVTLSVDMNAEITAGSFDPASDFVRVGGDFQGWTPTDNQMEDADENGVYSITFSLADGQDLLYKFVINDWGTNEFGEGTTAGSCNVDDGAGNVNRTYTVSDSGDGTDAVDVYIYNTCDVSDLGITNINEISTIENVTIAPNPATDHITVTYTNPNAEEHVITVTSLTGQVIKQFANITDNNITIQTSDLSAGMYFLSFTNEQGEIGTERFIVR